MQPVFQPRLQTRRRTHASQRSMIVEIVVVSVQDLDEYTLRWTFNAAVTVTSTGACAQLVADGNDGLVGADSIAADGPRSIVATYDGGGVFAGNAWQVHAVPVGMTFVAAPGASFPLPQNGVLA